MMKTFTKIFLSSLLLCLSSGTLLLASEKTSSKYYCKEKNLHQQNGTLVLETISNKACAVVLSLIEESPENLNSIEYFCNSEKLTSTKGEIIAEFSGSYHCNDGLTQMKNNKGYFCNDAALTSSNGKVIAKFTGAYHCKEGLEKRLKNSIGYFCNGSDLVNSQGTVISTFAADYACNIALDQFNSPYIF